MPHRPRPRTLSAILLGALVGGSAALAGEMAVPPGAAGQKACIDPATGQLVTPDQSPECAAALEAARKEEAERMRSQDDAKGLEEQPLEGGGSKVDLDGQLRQNQVVPSAPEAPVQGGQIAIIDPMTGQLVSGAAAEALARQSPVAREAMQEFEAQLRERAAASVESAGLQEQQIEAGGVKVDLQGRFRSPLVARIGADGTISVEHPAPKTD